jgi:hypothetical protein
MEAQVDNRKLHIVTKRVDRLQSSDQAWFHFIYSFH